MKLSVKKIIVILDNGSRYKFPDSDNKLNQLQRLQARIFLARYSTPHGLWKKHHEDSIANLKAALRIEKFRKRK